MVINTTIILIYAIMALVVAIISATIMRTKLSHWDRFSIKEISNSLKPCPICGKKAALIEMIDIEGNYRTWWHVECEDFDDHGGWTLPIRCNFNGAGYWGKGFRTSYCPEDAARLWNEVVVPTAIRTQEAMERVRKYDDEHQGK